MLTISFSRDELAPPEQQVVSAGFAAHAIERGAPAYDRTPVAWRARDERQHLVGVLTGHTLWDWLYVDELWVDTTVRHTGLGRRLMQAAEEHVRETRLVGLWLWTQSWQAAGFYTHLGFERFAELPDFPRGHARIGFRKLLP
jgi:ribosomal protein S18 acetylase RimI-like enzyme